MTPDEHGYDYVAAPHDPQSWQDPVVSRELQERGIRNPTPPAGAPVAKNLLEGAIHAWQFQNQPEQDYAPNKEDWGGQVGEAVSGYGGAGTAGMVAGGLLGGLAGSVIPGAGTAAGAAIGASLGGAGASSLYDVLRSMDRHKDYGEPDTIQNTAPSAITSGILGGMGPAWEAEGLAGRAAANAATGYAGDVLGGFSNDLTNNQPLNLGHLIPGMGALTGGALGAAGHFAAPIASHIGNHVFPEHFNPAAPEAPPYPGTFPDGYRLNEQGQAVQNPGRYGGPTAATDNVGGANVPVPYVQGQPLQAHINYAPNPNPVYEGEHIPPTFALPSQPTQTDVPPTAALSTSAGQAPGLLPSDTGATTPPNFTMGPDIAATNLQGIQQAHSELSTLVQAVPTIKERAVLDQVLQRIQALRGQLNIQDPVTQAADQILSGYGGPPNSPK